MSQLFIIKEWKHGVRGAAWPILPAASINSSFLEYSGKTVRYAFNVETTRVVSHSWMHNAVPPVSHLPCSSLCLSASLLPLLLSLYRCLFLLPNTASRTPFRLVKTIPMDVTAATTTTTSLASWPACELTPPAYVPLLFLAWNHAISLNAVSCRLHKSRDIGLERV